MLMSTRYALRLAWPEVAEALPGNRPLAVDGERISVNLSPVLKHQKRLAPLLCVGSNERGVDWGEHGVGGGVAEPGGMPSFVELWLTQLAVAAEGGLEEPGGMSFAVKP